MKKIIFTIIILSLITLPAISLAQSFDNPITSIGNNPSIENIVGNVIRIILGLLGVIALILFIGAGFTWMTAQGNAQKIETAQKIMAWAGIGLLVIFSSYALLNFVFNII